MQHVRGNCRVWGRGYFEWDLDLSVALIGFESNQDNRQSSKKNNKYQLLYTYVCIS